MRWPRRNPRGHRPEPAGRTPRHAAERPYGFIPHALQIAASWSWRIIVIGIAVYFIGKVLAFVSLVTIALFLALLLTALLYRPVALLRRIMPPALAAIVILLAAFVAIGGVGYVLYLRINAEGGTLANEAQHVYEEADKWVQSIPGIGIGSGDLLGRARSWVMAHSSMIVSGAAAAGRAAFDFIAGLFLTMFLALFFLIDGERQWSWLVRLLPQRMRTVANGSGRRAFAVLSRWISGTAVIGVIHGVVVGVTLWIMGAPLVLVLAVLVFVGTFIPVIGSFLFGGLAVVVVLLTVGWLPAVILIAVLIVESLLEGHVYQPLIIGRALGLHPAVILLAFSIGGIAGGIFGAIATIPALAAVAAGIKYATGIEDIEGHPIGDDDRGAPIAPPRVYQPRHWGRRHYLK